MQIDADKRRFTQGPKQGQTQTTRKGFRAFVAVLGSLSRARVGPSMWRVSRSAPKEDETRPITEPNLTRNTASSLQ